MPTKSPLLLLGALLTFSISACSSPDADPSPSEEESTSTSTSSSSSSPSASSSSSVAQATTQEPTSETPAEPETQVTTEELGTQPQAATPEPELLYCEMGLGAVGRFSDGSSHQTELCNTPALQRSVRAEAVCGGINGHLLIQTSGPNSAMAALHIRDHRRVEPHQNSMTKVLLQRHPRRHKEKDSRAVPRSCIPPTFSQML